MASPVSNASTASSSMTTKKIGGKSAKLIIVGSISVGKTSILKQYITSTFDIRGTQTTLGCDFSSCNIPIQEADGSRPKTYMKAALWDTAGMESFSAIAPSFFRGADGAILVYDITNKNSFDSARTWRDLFVQHAGKAPILLVGNKLDLEDKRAVPTEAGIQFMKDSDGVVRGAVELTAADHDAVENAFSLLGKAVMEESAKTKATGDNMMSQSDIRRVRMGSVPPSQSEPTKKDCAC